MFLCTIVSFKWTSDRLIASCTIYEFVFHFLKLSPPLCIIDLDLAYSSNAFFLSRIPEGMFERVSLPPIHVKRKHCKMKRAKLTPKAQNWSDRYHLDPSKHELAKMNTSLELFINFSSKNQAGSTDLALTRCNA